MPTPLNLHPEMDQPSINSTNDPVQVALRPECAADEAFLLELYASTREEELAFMNLDAASRALFVKMQFTAMRHGYANAFPHAQFSVIVSGEIPIGRIVIHRAADEIRVVDLALVPNYRRRGIGSEFLQQLLAEARQAGKPVQLSVLKTNPAARLYERLGFKQTGEDDFYRQMEWRPTAA